MMLRVTAKTLKPRLIVTEAGGRWTLQSQSKIKNTSYDFTPGQTFDEVTPDGREVTVKIFQCLIKRRKSSKIFLVNNCLRR